MKIRRATDEDHIGIAHVEIATWQSTYSGIIPDEHLLSMTIENRAKNWQRNLKTLHTVTFIAENDTDEIIGFAAGGPEQTRGPYYQAEIYAIYILDAYQRNGIGKQLIKQVAERLKEKNYKNIIIWALEENAKRAFYESLGGQLVASKPITICGKELKVVGYGWNTLDDLITHL